MTTQTLSPVLRQKFFDNNGQPLVSGKVFTYSAGTTTKISTYTDFGGLTPNTNPVILDYRGEANIWIPPNVSYKFVLAPANDTDPPTHPIWSIDEVVNSQLLTLYGGVDTGIADQYVLTFTASFSSYDDGIIIYWIPANTNTGPATINVNGLGPVAITQQNGDALLAGQIQANQIVQIMYLGTGFVLIGPISSSFTATLTGVTATVTGTARWTKNGRAVSLVLPILAGTSNSTAKRYTGLPAEIVPAFDVYLVSTGLDNSGAALEPISAFIGAGNNYVEFFLLTSDGLWTTSGGCSISGGTMQYESV